jgi:hypothetical protein
MAFSYTVTESIPGGNGARQLVYGTFTNDGGSTGGDIVTGLALVQNVVLSHTGSGVVASAPVVNETLPLANAGGTVTIVTVANTTGCWQAAGY